MRGWTTLFLLLAGACAHSQFRYDDGGAEAFLGGLPRITIVNRFFLNGEGFDGRFDFQFRSADPVIGVAAIWLGPDRAVWDFRKVEVEGGRARGVALTPVPEGPTGELYLGLFVPYTRRGNRVFGFAPVDLDNPVRQSFVGRDGLDIRDAQPLHVLYPSLDGVFLIGSVPEPSTGLYGLVFAALWVARPVLKAQWTCKHFKRPLSGRARPSTRASGPRSSKIRPREP